jgi:hypothetical protein
MFFFEGMMDLYVDRYSKCLVGEPRGESPVVIRSKAAEKFLRRDCLQCIPGLQHGVTWYASRCKYSYKWNPANEH